MAFSCVAPSGVPCVIGAGAAQVSTGAVRGPFTTSVCVTVAVEYRVRSAGVKVALSVCVPAGSTVPATGLYANVPFTFAVAFSCVAPSAVPCVIGAGAAQVSTGAVRAPSCWSVRV